ncbi:alpha/beta hydrolase [Lentilactobacillus raoultii]|uniref:Alpha/beta hydrolase n=1 Tax=Lentilactobacillus raoultii TaxID=1987503 RepID=A0ABW3PLD3_9LACO|nr:alpha/beta hydrolase [Lentilactobacillus raoultii]
MSFMAKRLLKKFKKKDYKTTVNHIFLHPNQKVSLFTDKKFNQQIHLMNYGQVVTLQPTDHPDNQILYFHGGAFTVPMNADQLEMITKIATKANSLVQVVDFPLLPTNSSADLLASAQAAFEFAKTKSLPIFIVADSAGAALAMQVLIRHADQIGGTSLISPWLDMGLEAPELAAREATDVMLSLSVLRQIGRQFAADLTDENWSDVFNPQNLEVGKIQIFYGENELLAPVNRKFIAALNQAANAEVEVTAFKDGFHDYSLWFKLPETKKTFKKIVEFIRSLV